MVYQLENEMVQVPLIIQEYETMHFRVTPHEYETMQSDIIHYIRMMKGIIITHFDGLHFRVIHLELQI